MIDLRSDTVTKPTASMRRAMSRAEVGDDVYGEDPTVNKLEAETAEVLGAEAALFCSSGTQSNLLALLSHCGRGDEYIVGQQAHTYKFEGGGAAIVGGIQPQPMDFEQDGTIDLGKAATFIKPEDDHFAKTKLFCLENTNWGRVLPLSYLDAANEFVKKNRLAMHLDGARVFNAAVKLNVPVSKIAEKFDSVSVCMSKGLGAPVGSVLCGRKQFIKKARRWRKVAGGGMRQAGIIAAGALHALQHNVERLEKDHQNAQMLASALAEIEEIEIDLNFVQTNIIIFRIAREKAEQLTVFCREHGVIISHYGGTFRLVTHLDATKQALLKVIRVFEKYFTGS